MKKLLLVDDEPEIVEFLDGFLSGRGNYQIFRAYARDEAIQLVEKEKPDLMLLDLKLRNKESGFEVLKATMQISSKTKVIMVTAIEDQESIQEAFNLGACDYITKPLSLEYLETTVTKKLEEA